MNTPKYGNTISTITQSALPKPETSRRRNRSPKTVMSNQNHRTKINTEKTSARKFVYVKPPRNNMLALLFVDILTGLLGKSRNAEWDYAMSCFARRAIDRWPL